MSEQVESLVRHTPPAAWVSTVSIAALVIVTVLAGWYLERQAERSDKFLRDHSAAIVHGLERILDQQSRTFGFIAASLEREVEAENEFVDRYMAAVNAPFDDLIGEIREIHIELSKLRAAQRSGDSSDPIP